MYVAYIFMLSLFPQVFNVYCMQPTTVLRRDSNVLLRKRRYLEFPEGSNMVFTLSFVKAVMVKKPKGHMSLLECDIPFKLPSAEDRTIKHKFRYGRSAELKFNWIKVFDRLGIDGSACAKRIICEAESIAGSASKSIMSRIIQTLFRDYFGTEDCIQEELNCILPSLPTILMKILRLETFSY